MNRPVAILVKGHNNITDAIQWALYKLENIEYYSSHDRRLIADGRTYWICWIPEHLRGIEISSIVNMGANEDMMHQAAMRIRH